MADVVARERRLWELVADRDLDAFAACLLRDCVFVDGAVVQTPTEVIEGLRTVTLTSFTLSNVTTRSPADGVEVVVYEADETLETSAGDVSRGVVATSMWVERDGTWLLGLHHESPRS